MFGFINTIERDLEFKLQILFETALRASEIPKSYLYNQNWLFINHKYYKLNV